MNIAKSYAVELDYCGRRKLLPQRYPSRTQASEHCERIAPLFRARIVVVRGEPVRPPVFAAFADTVATP